MLPAHRRELRRLRFEPQREAEFRRQYAEAVVTGLRWAILVNTLAFVGARLAAAYSAMLPEGSELATVGVVTTSALTFSATYYPRWKPYLEHFTTWGLAIGSGFAVPFWSATLLQHPSAQLEASLHGALLVVLVVQVTAFTLTRLPLRNALIVCFCSTTWLALLVLRAPTLPSGFAINAGLTVPAVALMGIVSSYWSELSARKDFLLTHLLAEEQERSETLLQAMLPARVAERLKTRLETIAEHHPCVTVLFADVVGFTPIAASQPPEATVEMLSHLFADFDAATERHGLERIKLVGDAYMAVGGLHTGERDHAADATRLALELRILARRHGSPEHGPLQVRIGVCTGPVVAGVIGSHRFQYDLWGNTVNMASHLASHGVPGGIQVAEETRRLLGTQFQFTLREVRIKGRESARVHLLEGECGTQVAIPDTHRDAPAASARPSP